MMGLGRDRQLSTTATHHTYGFTDDDDFNTIIMLGGIELNGQPDTHVTDGWTRLFSFCFAIN